MGSVIKRLFEIITDSNANIRFFTIIIVAIILSITCGYTDIKYLVVGSKTNGYIERVEIIHGPKKVSDRVRVFYLFTIGDTQVAGSEIIDYETFKSHQDQKSNNIEIIYHKNDPSDNVLAMGINDKRLWIPLFIFLVLCLVITVKIVKHQIEKERKE